MKILYDTQIFTMQRFGGISNYFANIIKQLQKTQTIIFKGIDGYNEYIGDITNKSFPIKKKFKGKRTIITYISNLMTKRELITQAFDVFHPTYYKDYFLELNTKPFVITVYDMIHELFPELYDPNDFVLQNKRKLCNAASRIIAISEKTKSDLIKVYQIPAEKIDVVHLATDYNVCNNYRYKLNLPSKYILFVGNRSGYKNFNWILEALANVLKLRKVQLLCIGNSFDAAEQSLINNLGLKDFVLQNNFKHTEMPEVYNRAEFFIFPSRYEGFGIPILEAFSSKVPVLLSDASCFPEVAGDAALYFELDNIEQLQQHAISLLTDKDLRNSLIQKGLKQLAKFSWEICAKETLNVYQKACAK